MAQAIPLVRAIALVPTLRWLCTNGFPVEAMLERRGLPNVLHGNPFRPVPLLNVGRLLRDIAEHIGPDAACRIIAETNDRNLVQVGRVALGTNTPHDALMRISAALPFFCSHELLNAEIADNGVVVRHSYGVGFDPETLHLMSQYALAVLDRICAMSGASAPRLRDIEIPGHPGLGAQHLDGWFRTEVATCRSRSLHAIVPNEIAQRPFPRPARDRSAELARLGLTPLRGAGGFAVSVNMLMAAMIEDEEASPTLRQVATAAGLSTRTFQRRLHEEGSSFKSLLDETRREHAIRLISDGQTVAGAAGRLGYSRPTSLNRSMMRWEGCSPTTYRQRRG